MKKKTRKSLLVFLALILVFSIFILVACVDPSDKKPDEKPTTETSQNDGTLINNGSFKFAKPKDPNSYLQSDIVNWSTNDGAFKSTDSKVKMGVIELDDKLFAEKKAMFNFTSSSNPDLTYSLDKFPGIAPSTPKNEKGEPEDKNALIISMQDIDKKHGSVFYSLSSSSTLAKNTFYKLSIDVYTDLFQPSEKSGAAIEITSTMYSQILSINTNKGWNTYTFYISTNKYNNNTFNLKLWLGHGPEYLGNSTNLNPYLAAGSVLFDNILVEPMTNETEISNIKSTYTNGEYKDIDGKISRFLDLAVVDPGFNAITDYTSSYSSSSNDYYYSAKRGIQSQYDFHIGDKKLTSDERTAFPDYPTYTSSNFPIGIFDMSKLYTVSKNADGVESAVDNYKKIDSTFIAPTNYKHFMKKDASGDWNYDLLGSEENGRNGSSIDTTALLVWHPAGKVSGAGYTAKNKITIEKDKYYDISVWVYTWIPEAKKPAELSESEKQDVIKVRKYEQDLEMYNKYMTFYNKDSKAQAFLKLSGASVEDSDRLLSYSQKEWGQWEQLTIKIKGNSLSKREITPEFWYGHGYWGDSTLMPGATLFDDLTIRVRDSVDTGEEQDYHELSILSEGDYKGFGLFNYTDELFEELTEAEGKVWKYKRVDDEKLGVDEASKNSIAGRVSGNSDFINSKEPIDGVLGLEGISKGPGTLKIKHAGSYVNTDLLLINHKNNDTSSSVSFLIKQADIDINTDLQDLLLVRPNNFYRFSFWINTESIPSNMSAKVKILQIDSEDETKTKELSTFSNINVDEWTEYIAYIKGAETESHRFGFEIILGEGEIADLDTRTSGVVFFTAPTWQKISNEEFKEANKNLDTTKEITASDSSSSKSSALTNGYFKNFDSSEYKNTEKFNNDGYLTKEVKPTSWQYNEQVTGLDAVKAFKVEGSNKLTWEKVEGATQYYVYMNEYETKKEVDGVEKTIKKDDILVEIVEDPALEYVASRNGKYYIRAAGPKGAHYNGTNYSLVFSPKTTALDISGAGTGAFPEDKSTQDKLKITHGIINYKYYDKLGYVDEETAVSEMYGDAKLGNYISTNNDNLLMISSEDAEATILYKYNSTYTISKGSYYMVSVWVKTIGADTKASITLEDSSSTLVKKSDASNMQKGEYAGFVDVNTSDKWVQYRILINTGYVDGRVTLELALGNKYTKASDGKEDDKLGLSKGTVYFDDIDVKKLDSESDFNIHAYGIDNIENKESSDYKIKENELYLLADIEELKLPYTNQAMHTMIDYRVDSFDSTSDSNDDYLGRKPGAYTHHQPAGTIPYQKPTGDDIPTILNGVYSERSLNDQIRGKISKNFKESELLHITKLNQFLSTSNGQGSNFLMMVNIENNAQYYEMTSGFDIEAGKYYKVSFWAKLLADSGKTAQFRFIPGKDSDDNTKIVEIKGETLKEYTFYVYSDEKNSTISSNKIAFHLGTNDGIGQATDATDVKNFFKGMLIIDDVAIEKMDEMTQEEFNQQINAKAAYKFDAPKESEEEPPSGNEENKDNTKSRMDSQMWLLISTIVIAAILVIALIILGARKLKVRFAKGQKIIVKSKVPTDLETEVKQAKTEVQKTEVDDSEFSD